MGAVLCIRALGHNSSRTFMSTQQTDRVAEALVDYIRPVRDRYNELRPDESRLESILTSVGFIASSPARAA